MIEYIGDYYRIKHVEISANGNCNMNCSYCDRRSRRGLILQPQLIRLFQIMEQVSIPFECHFVGGEPTLYPNLINILKYRFRVYFCIFTNLTKPITFYKEILPFIKSFEVTIHKNYENNKFFDKLHELREMCQFVYIKVMVEDNDIEYYKQVQKEFPEAIFYCIKQNNFLQNKWNKSIDFSLLPQLNFEYFTKVENGIPKRIYNYEFNLKAEDEVNITQCDVNGFRNYILSNGDYLPCVKLPPLFNVYSTDDDTILEALNNNKSMEVMCKYCVFTHLKKGYKVSNIEE